MLTIGQVASYAGVTVRTVRFYHQKGLLPEPERDQSGYRRYDVRAIVELIRIRTLAEAGVPLGRVKELLDAEELGAAVAEIDQRLRAEIRERTEHRRRIARLAAGDSLALPPEAVAYIERMRELGFAEAIIEAERDAWILIAARMPECMPVYMALKRAQIEEPATIALYQDFAGAIHWDDPDDSRLPDLVDRLVETIEAVESSEWDEYDEYQLTDELVDLLDSVFLESVPIAPRVLELLEERGWRGWTRFERVDAPPG